MHERTEQQESDHRHGECVGEQRPREGEADVAVEGQQGSVGVVACLLRSLGLLLSDGRHLPSRSAGCARR